CFFFPFFPLLRFVFFALRFRSASWVSAALKSNQWRQFKPLYIHNPSPFSIILRLFLLVRECASQIGSRRSVLLLLPIASKAAFSWKKKEFLLAAIRPPSSITAVSENP
ncbi:hypothetical protein LINPERHAP2_LOCUS44621, partial [Linum perenne]